ncbi:helix-turn-helix transcriptional regulator [Micromonospora sp. NPDC047812]|uniref:helix-turn-helix transcriptional regulator n=1 Tax=Micromonospora sp. NPDC047812 TaxID=3155742 RepID=UPI003456627F
MSVTSVPLPSLMPNSIRSLLRQRKSVAAHRLAPISVVAGAFRPHLRACGRPVDGTALEHAVTTFFVGLQGPARADSCGHRGRRPARRSTGRVGRPVGARQRSPADSSSTSLPPHPTQTTPGLSVLTLRDREVLTLIARGLSGSEIAQTLVLSEGSVQTHMNASSPAGHARTEAGLLG